MTGKHPDLEAAIEALVDNGDAAGVVRIALQARAAQDEGRYCECAAPVLAGADLMCGACLLNNRNQELRNLDASRGPHEFEPGALEGMMCAVCTCWEPDIQHHGGAAKAKTSWGEDYIPGSAGLPPLAPDEVRRYT